MFHLLNFIIFFFNTLLPLILCISNSTERRNGPDVAYRNEDIFGNITPPSPPPSKIDMYVNEWIRKILEVNETGSPSDVMNGTNIPSVSKYYYYVGMKWMIKKYCLNISSEKACIQVVLKPHVYEEIPLKFRLFRTGTDSDSKINHLGKKEFHKGYGARKHKKKYHKDDKHYKSRNAFDQFYKYLSKRKKKLLHSSNNPKNDNSIEKFTEHSSSGALGEPFAEHVSENQKRKLAFNTNTVKETVEKRTSSFLESFEYGPAIELSEQRIIYEPLKEEIGKMATEDDVSKPERKKEEENEIKERNKRSVKKKKRKKGRKSTPRHKKKSATTPEEDYDESEEDNNEDDEEGENEEKGGEDDDKEEKEGEEGEDDDKEEEEGEDDDEEEEEEDEEGEDDEKEMEDDDKEEEGGEEGEDDDEEEEEGEDDDEEEEEEEDEKEEEEEDEKEEEEEDEKEEEEEDEKEEEEEDDDGEEEEDEEEEKEEDEKGSEEEGGGDEGAELKDYGVEYDSSADDSSAYDEGAYNQEAHDPGVHGPDAHGPGVHELGVYEPDVYDPSAYDTGAEDLDPQDPGAVSEYTAQDWNRCQLPPPRKTSEVLCKVLPNKMICKLYCIHGHTFPEGITRKTVCELSKGAWSMKFEECLPFVDCTLKLKTAGYLKCTTNTVQTGPRCQVECQRYAEKAATDKKTYQCDVTGRWNPPLPHCVEREGIDVVQPPPNMFHAEMDYPQ